MSRVAHLLRAVPTLARVAWAEMVAYRAEMVIWILTATLPLVMLALWNAAAADGPIGAFGQAEFTRYFAITLFVRQLTGAWVVWEMNHMIRTGGLSQWLLKPVHPLTWNLAETMSAIPFRLVVLTPILGALFWWRPEIAFWPGAERAALFLLSVGLAFVLSWLVQVVFGLLAFWLDQSLGLFQAYFGIWAALSGYIVPLALLPPWLSEVARVLPFHASLGVPIDIVMGTEPAPWTAVGLQLGWIGVALVGAGLLWRAGVRRYGAFGA